MKRQGIKKNNYLTYRWFIWGILCFALLIVFFHRVSPAVVADNLMSEFSISGVTLGNLSAMYFYVYMIMQIPSGVLADTLGARKTVVTGALFSGVGSIIFGISSNINVSYIGRLIVGIGVSVIFVSILKILSEWFKEGEFGTMSGLTSFIGNGGGVLASAPLALAVAVYSWRTVFVFIGLLNIIVALLVYIIVRNKPEEMGWPSVTNVKRQKQTAEKNSVISSLKKVLTNRHTWPEFFAFFGIYGSLIAITGMWGVPYLMSVYGMEKTKASSYTMVAMIGLMIGSVVVGFISDKIRKRKLPFLVSGTLHFVILVIIVFWNSGKPLEQFLYPIFFLFGFAASGFVLSWAIGKEVNPAQYSGVAIGTVNIGGFLGSAIMQPLLGYILDSNWNGLMKEGIRIYNLAAYQKAFSMCLVIGGVALVSILLIKETNCTNIYKDIYEKQNKTDL